MPRCDRFISYLRLAAPLAVFILLALTSALSADEPAGGFVEKTFHDEAGDHKYTLFIPHDYTPDREWPVILYLHGFSARGNDNKLPLVGGLAPQVRAREEKFPFFVVFPQCEDVDSRIFYGWLAETSDAKRALKILDSVEQEFRVDRRREILTGWSMGGIGAYSIAAATPSRWSALAVVAGRGDESSATHLTKIPIWSFHGTKDSLAPLESHRGLIEAVRSTGGHATLTELPEAEHNIGHVVYGEDALYTWMFNPKAEPRGEKFVQNALRKPSAAESGRDFDPPFVPSVEIPQALFVRMDAEVLESLAYSLPGLIPDDALAGSLGDVYQTTRAAGLRFDVSLRGINYRGDVERIRVTTRDNGWANIQIGLRNMTMEIGSTHVDGFLMSSTAGPMHIVIGHERPVWLSIEMRPSVKEKKLHIEPGDVTFEIPDDNWYVTSPAYVSTRALPLIRSRVSSRISENLVNGAYGRKQEIESQIIASVPTLLAQLEHRLEEQMSKPRPIGDWPMPAYIPRFKVWPSQLAVDGSGLSMVLGMAIASPGLNLKPGTVRVIERSTTALQQLPQRRGLQVGQSRGVMEGFTASLIGTRIAVADARDLSASETCSLSDARQIAAAVPDLKRFGDALQIRTRIRLDEPFFMAGAESSTGAEHQGSSLENLLQFHMRGVCVVIDIKTSPDELQWKPCAEFDVQVTQQLRMNVHSPNFDTRTIQDEWLGHPRITATGHFAPGYQPQESTLQNEHVARMFGEIIDGTSRADLFQHLRLAEFGIGSAKFRVADVIWSEPCLVKRFVPARTRITNRSDRLLEYELRGPFSEWGGPYRLAPGEFHEYRAPYDMTFRQRQEKDKILFTLPAGSHSVYRPDSDGLSLRLKSAVRSVGMSSR